MNDENLLRTELYLSEYIVNAKDEGLASWALKNGYLDYLKADYPPKEDFVGEGSLEGGTSKDGEA
jgi:hypothetical protein